MSDPKESFFPQLRQALKDGIDYLQSVLMLLQAQLAHYALSTVVAIILLVFASVFAMAALVLLNIALGVWLTHALGNVIGALLLMAACYTLLVVLLAGLIFKWLKNLRS